MSAGVGVVLEHNGVSGEGVIERAKLAAKVGVDSLWAVQMPNQRDTAMLLAALAARVEGVTVGSAVIPIYSRPPVVMAQTAMTLDEMFGGRFILGLGAGHRMVGDWMIGVGYPPPALAMREYLGIVTDLIRTGEVNVTGRWFSGHMSYSAPWRPDLPVYVGSLGPRILELAGELADGVILWMCTPEDVRERVIPHLRAGWARRRGGRGEFVVSVMLNTSVTEAPATDREGFRRMLTAYLRMENYRKQFIASGFGDDVRSGQVSDTTVHAVGAIGDRHVVAERVAEFREAGATQIAVAPMVNEGAFDPIRFANTLEVVLSA